MTQRTQLMQDAGLEPELQARISAVIEEGREIFDRFDLEVRQREFHPFVPADYDAVLHTLIALRAPGRRFLEWGSGTGVITIMADMLGFEAYGIELDAQLVETARTLAARHNSNARFAAGSFIPTGYQWRSVTGDRRLGTIGHGNSGYLALGHPLEDFDVVYGYPWPGEAPVMRNLMRKHGAPDARLILQGID